MSKKETKKYLEQLRKYQFNIDHSLSELWRFETLATKTTAAISGDKVQTSTRDKLSDYVVKIADIKIEIARDYDNFFQARRKIVEQIEHMDNDEHRKLLLLRFDECLSFEKIPERLSMSRRTMFRIYNDALEAFELKYGNEYLSKSWH